MQSPKRGDPDYTGKLNWDHRSQPLLHGGPHDEAQDVLTYLEMARGKVPAYNKFTEDLQARLPFHLPMTPGLIKPEESSLRKLWDQTTAHPGQANTNTDYLRGSGTVPAAPKSVSQLAQVIDTIIAHPQTIAYKDQFWKPNAETGFRDFKAIVDIDGMPAELLIQHGGLVATNSFTKRLRGMERGFRALEEKAPLTCITKFEEATGSKSLSKLITRAQIAIEEIRSLRMDIHEEAAHKHGLNALLDTTVQRDIKPGKAAERLAEIISDDTPRTFFYQRPAPRLSLH